MTRPPLLIESATLRLVHLPLLQPFVIATGTMVAKVFPLLTLRAGDHEGIAEGVMDTLPDYLDETTAGGMDFLRTHLLPQIVGHAFESPGALEKLLIPWRGHQMTKAMVEMAFYDLWAKSLDLPLKTVLGGTGDAVPVGVSLGIGPVADTVARVAAHHQQGYKRIKLKIMPGHDIGLLKAVRAAFPDLHLSVDANCAYRLSDLTLLRQLDDYALDYIEQPLAWNDIHDHAALQRQLKTPLCLDESIKGVPEARKALQTGASPVMNIKVGRSGGYLPSLRIHDICAAYDVPVWCGGMLEAGIGRAHNIHLSTLPNFTKPGDVSSASRYFARDITVQKLEAVDGMMPVPPGPGIGVTLDMDYLATVTTAVEEFRA